MFLFDEMKRLIKLKYLISMLNILKLINFNNNFFLNTQKYTKEKILSLKIKDNDSLMR